MTTTRRDLLKAVPAALAGAGVASRAHAIPELIGEPR